MKLIKIKKITSKSDRLLHLNTPVNNIHFGVHNKLRFGFLLPKIIIRNTQDE